MQREMTGVEVFQEFLDQIQSKKIPLILLRPREISEEISYSGDYDFYLAEEYIDPILHCLFDIAKVTRTAFKVSRIKHGKIDIAIFNRADNRSIALEIWHILSVNDPYNKTVKHILPRITNRLIKQNHKDHYQFDLEFEALYYLSHLSTAKKDLDMLLVNQRIEHYLAVLPNNDNIIASMFKALYTKEQTIKEIAHQANMELVSRGLLGLKSNFKLFVMDALSKTPTVWKRFKRDYLVRSNIIVIIGPDGVGKTSLIDWTMQHMSLKSATYRFKKIFRTSPFYKLFQPFLRKKIKQLQKDPKKPGKGLTDDQFGNFVIANGLLMYIFRMILQLFTKKVILIDRYFHEYLLKNVRYQTDRAMLREDWKFWLRLIPQTHSIIHLDAPNEVVLSRKRELNEDGLNAYRELLFTVFLHKPFTVYLYLNTDNSLEISGDLIQRLAMGKKYKRKNGNVNEMIEKE